MVAQDHAALRAQIRDQPLALVQLGRDAFEVVIGDVVAGDHRGLRMGQQPFAHCRHRLPVRRVEVEHRGGVVACGVDRRMDDEAGAVHRRGRIVDLVAVEVDLDQ